MANLHRLEATRKIKTLAPEIKVLILTMHKEREYLYQALTAGAEGYLLKEDGDVELFVAIDTLLKGGTFISPLLSAQMTDKSANRFLDGDEPLTVRECQVVKLISEGKTSKEIGELLFISSRTVGTPPRARLMKKLNVKSTPGLVKYAIQRGYATGSTF